MTLPNIGQVLLVISIKIAQLLRLYTLVQTQSICKGRKEHILAQPNQKRIDNNLSRAIQSFIWLRLEIQIDKNTDTLSEGVHTALAIRLPISKPCYTKPCILGNTDLVLLLFVSSAPGSEPRKWLVLNKCLLNKILPEQLHHVLAFLPVFADALPVTH